MHSAFSIFIFLCVPQNVLASTLWIWYSIPKLSDPKSFTYFPPFLTCPFLFSCVFFLLSVSVSASFVFVI
jgi:hypothetical protein